MIAVQSSKFVLKAAGIAAAFALATGCMTGSDGRPSNQAMGTVIGAGLGGTVGGLAFGSVGGVVGGALVGAIAGNLVGRALDDQERRRLAEATQRAFDAETNQPTVYTVEPQAAAPASATTTTTASQPTVVAAKPTAPKSTRSDGSTCRPIELTATKNGQTTTETTTFCQAAGSSELKPVNV